MASDFDGVGQANEVPSTGASPQGDSGQADSTPSGLDSIVEVGGQQMKVGDLVNSYTAARTTLDRQFSERDTINGELEELKKFKGRQ